MVLRNKVKINNDKVKGLGYLRGLNSIKDYDDNYDPMILDIDNTIAKSLDTAKRFNNQDLVMSKTDAVNIAVSAAPKSFDISEGMSPVRDQGFLGSCTSYAATGMVEYMQRKAYKKYEECSTMFTYKTTRNLMQIKGDTGAWLRSVMGSIAMIGVAPERYYPYDGREEAFNDKFDKEPPNFVYAMAQNYQSLKYMRLDQPHVTAEQLVERLKYYIRYVKIPIMFGFTVYNSIDQASNTDSTAGQIPFPSTAETVIGGHAVTICGYDDEMVITNKQSGNATKGAFKFKNSWSTDWGVKGYGFLPYDYFRNRLADDCWILMSQEWIDNMQFQE